MDSTRFVSAVLVSLCICLGGCITELDNSRSALDDVTVEGGESCIGGEPDLPYNLDIECGDSLISVIAAFNQKTDGPYAFAPHPDAKGACPFLVEEATIHKDAVETCAMITATEADAATEGNKALGEDRIWVTWCWYTEEGVVCETDHMTLRYSCGDGDGDVADNTWPVVGPDCQEPDPDPNPNPDPDPNPECVDNADCPTGELCNEGSCAPIIL